MDINDSLNAQFGLGNTIFTQGYMKRQALYACMTCCPADGEQQAGVCLACSYHCHEDHDLVELYTKRQVAKCVYMSHGEGLEALS
ncbi:putative E3 ubiquitin-protein ligase UBR7 [Portunus trituberculatus]|uniref:Putative E3 ubiquitin-protein ligase UBR7 n=1 Tax=Portunus trituberculatus TaxID=210409 RepID=A0A5B7GWS0_PORTR|nr:putative E3 ubiquitin-protein ligase UBR7 [Portunus trituberculatus]